MSTNFERLFPLLSLESCLSFATGSRNGPRFEAVDRTSHLPYEVRVIRLYRRSASSSLIPTAVSAEGSAPSPQQQQLRDATTQRAAALLSAASQVRGGSEQTVASGTSSREAFPFLFPEDVYIAQEEEWDRTPSSSCLSSSPTLASSSEGRITSDHRSSRMLRAVPRCHAVMVFRKCGPSLYDLLKQVQDVSLRNHAGSSHATGTMASPVFITERSFQSLCQIASCYAKTHLAFPVHGNLSLNSFVLRSTKPDEEEWWLTDWSGEDCQFSSDEQKVDSLNVDEERSFGQTKKVHVKLLRILQSAFAPPLHVHQSTSESRTSEPKHRTNQKFLRVIGSSSSTPLSLEAVECQIVEAVCGQVHNNPTTTKISNGPLGVSSEGDPLPLIEAAVRSVQMAGEVEINESSTSAARGGPSSSSVASPTPISDEESKQLSLLAVERVEASVEARTHFTQQDEPERKNDIGPSSTSGSELERIAGRDEIPLLSADVLRQLLICRQRFLRRISDPVTITAADPSLRHDGGSTSPSPPALVEPHWYYDPYVPPFHASADYQSLRSSRTCIAAQDPRPDMGSSSSGNHHHSDSCHSISRNKQDSSKTSNNDHKSCCAVM